MLKIHFPKKQSANHQKIEQKETSTPQKKTEEKPKTEQTPVAKERSEVKECSKTKEASLKEASSKEMHSKETPSRETAKHSQIDSETKRLLDTKHYLKAQAQSKEKKKTKTQPKPEQKQPKKRKKRKKRKKLTVKKAATRLFIVLSSIYILFHLAFAIFTHTDYYKKVARASYKALEKMDEGNFRQLENTKFYDAKGNLIGETDSGTYIYTEIKDIPQNLQNAYIALEDKRFMEHKGVDWKATFRAAVKLVKHKGNVTQGGSTITQQVIKNNLLTQEKTFVRKFTEILTAPTLEKQYGKPKIMEFYCNSNYYGNGCYGIGSAARFYFGKAPKDLTAMECALLASSTNAPNKVNPVVDLEATQKRAQKALKVMKAEGYLTGKEYKAAKAEKVNVTQTETTLVSSGNAMCSYATHCLTLKLMEKDDFHFEYTWKDKKSQEAYEKKYSDEYKKMSSKIREGGYSIHTSFDADAQKQLDKQFKKELKGETEINDEGRYAVQMAGMIADNKTGLVKAIYGGRDSYNRAFLAPRQPGSSIKPLLVYGPALDLGRVNPSTVMEDKEVHIGKWHPKNAWSGYGGAMSLRKALAMSVNTIPVQLYDTAYTSYLNDMHFENMDYADMDSPALSLGGFTNGVTVSDMTKGYLTIARGGKTIGNTCLVKVTHEREGELNVKEKEKQVYHSDASFMLTDMMQGVFRETYGTCGEMNMVCAGKTGTTNGNKDAWLCAFDANTTICLWCGRDDGKTINQAAQHTKNVLKSCGLGAGFKKPSGITLKKCKDGVYGDDAAPKKTEDVYKQRPENCEWYTSRDFEQKEEDSLRIKELTAAGKKAADNFDKYTIETVDDVLNLDDTYSGALATATQVPDPELRRKLVDRIEKKYRDLKDSIGDDWDRIIEEAEQRKAKKIEADREKSLENSRAASRTALKKERIKHVEWYIKEFNSRSYYSSSFETMASDARRVLENCQGYDEYDSLKKRLEAAIKFAQSLPDEPVEEPNEYDETINYPDTNTNP